MTLTQIEYIVAVEKHGSFVTAAEKCYVTQPTLSMQIQKLEEELGTKIFDRNHHPIIPTDLGKRIIDQSKLILFERNKVDEILFADKEELHGTLKIGIIPTVAPYILPKTLKQFVAKYPKLDISVTEMTTEAIKDKLREDAIDFGIASTPLNEKTLKEQVLYNEPYVMYFSTNHKMLAKKIITPEELDVTEIWTLSDEHCMKAQVINICGKKKFKDSTSSFEYNSGSIASLIKMVDINGGCTIIPEMCIAEFTETMLEQVRYFKAPLLVREISIVTNRYFTKNKIANAFTESLLQQVPADMRSKTKKRAVLAID
jgi:LysR family hydrogen peroxide-inducible transcriptional activator